jgi:glycosyltransferase involved in cell wall biosynthesis
VPYPPELDVTAGSGRTALRVLWLTTGADTDGPGRALLAVLNRWDRDDELAVCALRGVSQAFRRECRPDVAMHAVGMRGGWDVGAIGRLARYLRGWRPDVVHTQLSRADWIGRPLARALGIPVISTMHNVHSRMYAAEFPPAMARLGLLCDSVTARAVTRFVAVSNGVGRDLERLGVHPSRITVIHNGVNLDHRPPVLPRDEVRRRWQMSPGDIVVGTVALFKAQKGLQFLVEAARIAADADRRLRFVHMGDGPLRGDIVQQIEAAGLASRFTLLDRVPDPLPLLSGFDMFVLPSMWEGLPIALLEAMSVGLPAVGTAVTGIEEVIVEGENGLLVPPADSASLAAAMLRLAADQEWRRAMADGARRSIARFASDRIAAEYRRVTLDVVSASRSAAERPLDPPNVGEPSNI